MIHEDEIRLAALKRDLAVGTAQLEHGRYRIYNDVDLTELAEEICRCGRIQIDAQRLRSVEGAENNVNG